MFSICRSKIPIVNQEWIKRCFETKKFVDINSYLVGETGVNLLKLQRLNSSLLSNQPKSSIKKDPDALTSLASSKRIRLNKTQSRASLMDQDFSNHGVETSIINPIESVNSVSIKDPSRIISQLLENKSGIFHGKIFSSVGFPTQHTQIIIKQVEKHQGKYVTMETMEEFPSVYLVASFETYDHS